MVVQLAKVEDPKARAHPNGVVDRPKADFGAPGSVSRLAVSIAKRVLRGSNGRRCARRLLALHLLGGEADTLTFRRDGVAWAIPVNDRIISRMLFETGGFHLEDMQALVGWLESNDQRWTDRDLILEIGANIGTTTVPVALVTGRRVLALEPDPSNFSFLQQNVEANALSRVSCLQIAISDTSGPAKMVVDPSSSGSTEMWEDGMSGDVIEVETKTLSDVLQANAIAPDDVGLVWSDTEGFERRVIESGKSLWAAGVPLWVEIWPPGLRRHGGIDQLSKAIVEHFEYAVTPQDLLKHGSEATRQPVLDYVAILADYPDSGTDVLLIPHR